MKDLNVLYLWNEFEWIGFPLKSYICRLKN